MLRFLAARKLLLVLDNLEHVLPSAVFVARVLEECREVTVLATSREPTALAAERRYPVDPLEVPDASAPLSDLDRFGGVAMFLDRVRARDPRFVLDEGSASDVVEICRRLEGLPLALELAAGRSELMGPADLAARLDRALGLLVGGARDAPARQRTMRATIDWSFRALSGPARHAFARMALFRGGATVDAAEEVTRAPLELLESLLAKHLIVRRDRRCTCSSRCASTRWSIWPRIPSATRRTNVWRGGVSPSRARRRRTSCGPSVSPGCAGSMPSCPTPSPRCRGAWTAAMRRSRLTSLAPGVATGGRRIAGRTGCLGSTAPWRLQATRPRTRGPLPCSSAPG